MGLVFRKERSWCSESNPGAGRPADLSAELKYHLTFFLGVKNHFRRLSNDRTPASCDIWTPIWKTLKGQVKREARCSHIPLPSYGSVPAAWEDTCGGVCI